MHVLIVGDSHTGPLERGRLLLQARGEAPADIDWRIVALGSGARMNRAFWRARGDHAELTDARYRQRLARIPGDGPRPDVIGLSMPLWSGRVMRAMLSDAVLPFDLVEPGAAPGRLISGALFRRIVMDDMAPSLRLATFLRAAGMAVVVIEPPGIFRDYRYLIKAPARVVLALQARVRAIQHEGLAAAGLPVVALPKEARDGDGFMRRCWRHEDPTDSHHANAAFGAVMLTRVGEAARALHRDGQAGGACRAGGAP